ncbi:ATP-binding protein [Methylotuvimicrobium sp.]|uniref:sensor histidine kinase n=1 Tax=Methylotuvimicrobium sp. TaxID=2822413 RepID=UPI003D6474D8
MIGFTGLWHMSVSASFIFALIHFFAGMKGVKPWANFSFAAAAFSVAIITGIELMMMRTTSIEHMAMFLRWVQLPIFVLWLAIFCFVRCYFEAGRSWLAWTGGFMRFFALVLGFTSGQNLFFNEITHLKQVVFFGSETISIPEGTLNPWYFLGPLSTLALAAFVLNATYMLWRKDTDISRRRALLLSSSILFFLLSAFTHNVLVNTGNIDLPYVVGFYFIPILVSMSYELSYDMFHTMQIAHQLQASEAELLINKERIKLAASAANLRLWEWDIVHDEIWSTEQDRTLYGVTEPEKISFDRFLHIVYEEDREGLQHAVKKAFSKTNGNGHYECEYRVKMPDCQIHWFNSRGQVEFNEADLPIRMMGITMDITRRKQAELALQQQRNKLTHLSRVTTLGELSGSLAHELNQPLAAILSNAQAAQRFLARDEADLEEIQDILKDIISEDKRAVEVIQRLRLLFNKGEMQHLRLDMNEVVEEVLKIVNSDLLNQKISVTLDLARNLPPVNGDRVQLQQVLINLILNACRAMSNTKPIKPKIDIRTEMTDTDSIQVSVRDQGPGIPTENLESIFEPFFSTDSRGMGLGLVICRTIITAHGGQIWAANNPDNGAVFAFRLPSYPGESA